MSLWSLGAISLRNAWSTEPLTVLMGVLHFRWGHIAYAEAALYVGIALLARHPEPVESRHPVGQT